MERIVSVVLERQEKQNRDKRKNVEKIRADNINEGKEKNRILVGVGRKRGKIQGR